MTIHTPDLFSAAGVRAATGHHASYPNTPGFRAPDTSRAAAAAMAPRQGTIQATVLAALAVKPMTSFELAGWTGLSYRSIQPRTSELCKLALIRDTGERRTDPETAKQAIVWGVVR